MLAEAVLCLSMAMYKEARGEPTEAIKAVGETILNRVEADRYPDKICDVVLSKKQFTWTKELNSRNTFGLMDYQTEILIDINQKDFEAYQKIEKIAVTMVHSDYSPRHNYSHFYSGKPPYWAKHKPAKKIGKLYFVKGVE